MAIDSATSFFPPEPEAGGYARAPRDDGADIAEARALLARIEQSDLVLFVGPNAPSFLPVVDPLRGGRRVSFICWPAVFLGPAWLLYRKMFGLAAIVCAAPFIGSAMHVGQDALRYLGVLPLIFGLFGRPLYLAKARATIARLRSENHPGAEAQRLIASAGGVSRAGAVIGAIILLSPLITSLAPAFVQGFVHGFIDSFNHALKAGH